MKPIFLIFFVLIQSLITAQIKSEGENLSAKSKLTVNSSKNLVEIYSSKKLGSFFEDGNTKFRLFAPNALDVKLVIFEKPEDENGTNYEMKVDKDGVWECELEGEKNGLYYGYKVFHSQEDENNLPLCTDPYAKAVTTYNTYMNPKKSIVYEHDYNWENDKWVNYDPRDLIIYEMHVRDMTAHPSSGAKHPGTYEGLVEKNIKGGINYIKSLGVNTIELLPTQEFANIEIPYKDSLNGKHNTWNPYERNHWGYMTSNYFAPESYYSENWDTLKWNVWSGKTGKQVEDFKDMIKALHKEGISVVMDVVYNHLSEYEIGNLKQIDKEYYFRLDENGNFIAQSYCGNDLKTERPMMRRLIIDSIIYWMKEYHIDGFRFDLGKLIDWKTVEEIIKRAKEVNPNVVVVCEPWGGGYDPTGFSKRGWGAWNDQIRNGIKGENPDNGLGWIFGHWYDNNNIKRIESYVNGTLTKDKFGLFLKKEHSVNYLESHDGYTLGDFIRIGTKEVEPDKAIKDADKFVKLSSLQMKLNKLAALFLFTSQGITMIHSGQEFARTKIIPINTKVDDPDKGHMDHNSYDKDNETNYINYNHAEANKELLDYYKGLIQLRNKFDAFRRAEYDEVKFYEDKKNEFALAYLLKHNEQTFFVGFNSNSKIESEFSLPKGEWSVIANNNSAGIKKINLVSEKIIIPSVSGIVLMKK